MEYKDFYKFVRANWTDGPGDTDRDLFIMSLGLAGETGEAVEHVKKYVRDGNLDLEKFALELGDVVHYWTRICQYFGLSPEEVFAMNVEKLEKRKLEGKTI